MVDHVQYWIELAEYDLETAKAMFTTQRWLYVGFMCHQAVEKTMKSYWCKSQKSDPPYTHNLLRLAQGSGLAELLNEEQLQFISDLMPMNIEARYPSYKEELFQRLTQEYCSSLLEKTKTLTEWIKQRQ